MLTPLLGLCPAFGALTLSLPPALPGPAPGSSSEEPPPIELLNQSSLRQELQRLAGAHSGLVSLVPIGASREGRRIEAVRIAAGDDTQARPAVLVVGGLEGPYAYTSGLVLSHARALAAGYGEDERITRLLDSTTLYLLPCANPDAAEARFASPLAETWATGRGVDNDHDGRSGEDPAQDVNGDGFVAQLRVPDPEGRWIEDPTDPRILIEADAQKGQRGKYKLWPEGRDLDGDERVAEDGPLDAEVNRNFPALFEEHTARGGLYATDEPEVLALVDFVIARGELALVLSYGARGNLVGEVVAQGEAQRGKEQPGVRKDDVALYEELGERYRAATGSEVEGSADETGCFQTWVYQHRGLPSLCVAPWEVPSEPEDEEPEAESEEDAKPEEDAASEETEAEPEPSEAVRRLAWLEQHGRDAAFLPWTAYEHPELGAVEIGGLAPYALYEPTGAELAQLAPAHLDYLLEVAELLPRVRLVNCVAKQLSKGLYEVEVALENDSLMPLQTAAALASRTLRPARLRLTLPPDSELLSGKQTELVSELAGAGGRKSFRWLVKTTDPTALTVAVDTPNAGAARIQAEVK